MGHYDCKECHQDPVSGHAPDCSRGKAMDELIAGDADLYAEIKKTANLTVGFPILPHPVPSEATRKEWTDEIIKAMHAEIDTWKQVHLRGSMRRQLERAIRETASARIKGDKDRENPVERPQLEYDHTQEGTANFERALSYARSLEIQADLSNSTYAAFMAERDDHLRVLTDLAHQYLSDLRYPPSSDSRERRIERIEAVLREVQP